MKRLAAILVLLSLGLNAGAQVAFDLFNDSALYNYLDDQVGPLSYTNENIVATFTAFGGNMNRTTQGFGVDAPGSADNTYLLDVDESFEVYFGQDITITTLDFRNFEDGEAIYVAIGAVTNLITWNSLSNRSSDYLENIAWEVPQGTKITFEVAGTTDAIAIDSITVVPEPVAASLIGIGGLMLLVLRRLKRG